MKHVSKELLKHVFKQVLKQLFTTPKNTILNNYPKRDVRRRLRESA